MLPRIALAREKQRGDFDDPKAEEYLSCHHCLLKFTESERSSWGCAFIPPQLRTGTDGLATIADVVGESELSECPGMAISLPDVYEAARAAQWANDGQLDVFFEGQTVTRFAIDCIDTFRAALKDCEAADRRRSMREMKKQQGGRHGPG